MASELTGKRNRKRQENTTPSKRGHAPAPPHAGRRVGAAPSATT